MICTVAEVKQFVFNSASSATFDDLITQLIEQAEEIITRKTGLVFGEDNYVPFTGEIINGTGKTTLHTKHKPIRAVTVLQTRQTFDTWIDYTDESLDDLEFHDIRSEIYSQYVIGGCGKRNVKITYTAGYKTSDVPKDINLIGIMIVAGLLNKRNMVGIQSTTSIGVSLSILPTEEQLIRSTIIKYNNIMVY